VVDGVPDGGQVEVVGVVGGLAGVDVGGDVAVVGRGEVGALVEGDPAAAAQEAVEDGVVEFAGVGDGLRPVGGGRGVG